MWGSGGQKQGEGQGQDCVGAGAGVGDSSIPTVNSELGYIFALSSKVGRGKACLFLDLDDVDYDYVLKVGSEIILKYGLGDGYVVESSPSSYHLVWFDVLPYFVVKGIVRKYADRQWARFREKSGEYVLRLSEKRGRRPRFIGIIKSPFVGKPKHFGLRFVFGSFWGYSLTDGGFYDSKARSFPRRIRVHVYKELIK